MTYLQLVQRLRQECGISGSGPSSVTGQIGEMKRLVDWTASAWWAIQSLHHDWAFLRQPATWVSVDGQRRYTPAQCGITNFGNWVADCAVLRAYTTASGMASEHLLSRMPYDDFLVAWDFNANRTVTGQPMQYAVGPGDTLAFGPTPTAGYTFVAEYYSGPVLLVADGDVPSLPTKHDPMLIVYRAMQSYAAFESAPEVLSYAMREYQPRLRRLEADQLARPRLVGAL